MLHGHKWREHNYNNRAFNDHVNPVMLWEHSRFDPH